MSGQRPRAAPGPSMRVLGLLAPPRELERRAKAIAVLDAILEPEWDYRYYAFNQDWDDALHQRLASMRNGAGDEWQIVFTDQGAFLKGFARESPVAKLAIPGARFVETLPTSLVAFASEPALVMETTTFCAWCVDGRTWERAPVPFDERAISPSPSRSLSVSEARSEAMGGDADIDADDLDGSARLLAILDGEPSTFQRYARAYYEEEIPLDAIAAIYRGRPLTRELVARIDPDRELDDLGDDLDEIGWPRGETN